MRALLHTEFAALLARADVSQAGFARLTGLTPRQVNNWSRGRAAVPHWAAALAILLEERSPEAITLLVEETAFAWHETLGVPPGAETGAIRLAMRRLALLYHPDQGGTEAQMTRVNAAYEQAGATRENRAPAGAASRPRP
jgi:hypothetical protein